MGNNNIITLKRIDKSLPIPEYKTAGSVGFDLYSRLDMVIPPRNFKNIPANIIAKCPKKYFMLLKARSSLVKRGLLCTAGVIDLDYCGHDDEIHIQVINYTDVPVKIKKGERLANAILVRFIRADIKEDNDNFFSGENRGGFGSTGI